MISSFAIINYEIIVNLIVWSFTLKLVLQACYEYHLTWAWVPHIIREMSGNFRVSGERSPWVFEKYFDKRNIRTSGLNDNHLQLLGPNLITTLTWLIGIGGKGILTELLFCSRKSFLCVCASGWNNMWNNGVKRQLGVVLAIFVQFF